MKNVLTAPFLLASASPRRREICRLAGIPIEIYPADTEPPFPGNIRPEDGVMAVARGKAAAVFARCRSRAVIGADTAVILDGRVMGKPGTPDEAAAMLRSLSGRSHKVATGVWVAASGVSGGFTDTADVTFAVLSDADIAAYVACGEPMDKAGGYGIQGAGMRFVERISGDFYTVMGLPGSRLCQFLSAKFEYTPFWPEN